MQLFCDDDVLIFNFVWCFDFQFCVFFVLIKAVKFFLVLCKKLIKWKEFKQIQTIFTHIKYGLVIKTLH